jgi:hypothetical protein
VIRQDIATSVRPVVFTTKYDEFPCVTNGGTLFLVSYRGRAYGITCRHALDGFEASALFVANKKHFGPGTRNAPVKTLCYGSSPRDAAVGTDVTDACLIEFVEAIGPDYFYDSPYIFDASTATTSKPGHSLVVHGLLKDKCNFIPGEAGLGYCRLEFHEVVPTTSDPVLRTAEALYDRPEFANLTGISGAPVFDITANALCGMVVRGGMQGNRATVQYIDAFDLLRFVEAVSSGATSTYYLKPLNNPNFAP